MKFSLLKTFFIPHKENDFKPHAFRIRATLIFLSVVLFIEIIFLTQSLFLLPRNKFLASVFPSVVLNLVNEERSSALMVSSILQTAAQQKADDMAQKGYFSHVDPEGKYPWYWFKKIGYDYTTAGENLAIQFFDSKDLVQAWMDSPTHKANIVNPQFTQTGIGIAQGLYEGKNTVFIVQFFGKPATKTQATQPQTLAPQAKPGSEPAAKPLAQISPVQEVQGIADTESSPPSLFSQIVSTPRTSAVMLYATLFTIIILLFFLNIFVHIKEQRSEAIIDGALMLVCVGSVLLFNNYLTLLWPVGL